MIQKWFSLTITKLLKKNLKTKTKSNRPPAPLPSTRTTGIHRHSSMRHLSTQSHMPEMMAAAKKRFTPPPSMAKSSVNIASNFSYGNQFNTNISIDDKVIILSLYFLLCSPLYSSISYIKTQNLKKKYHVNIIIKLPSTHSGLVYFSMNNTKKNYNKSYCTCDESALFKINEILILPPSLASTYKLMNLIKWISFYHFHDIFLYAYVC